MDVDARKPLGQLQGEWSTCQRCPLGERRLHVGAHFVPGVGYPRSVMLIGDGPNEESEQIGAPFVGRSGGILRAILARLGLKEYYLTNLVACRSCVPQTNASGEPMQRRIGGVMTPVYKDETPIPAHIAACRPRINEEIYLVDPTVIVGLGPKVCEALTGRAANLARDNGEARPISIPGASRVAELTDKGAWLRKVKGQWIQPVARSEVRYHFVPTYHPLDVERVMDDMSSNSVFNKFIAALRTAVQTHDAYLEGAYGMTPANRGQATDLDLQHVAQQEAQTHHEEA